MMEDDALLEAAVASFLFEEILRTPPQSDPMAQEERSSLTTDDR